MTPKYDDTDTDLTSSRQYPLSLMDVMKLSLPNDRQLGSSTTTGDSPFIYHGEDGLPMISMHRMLHGNDPRHYIHRHNRHNTNYGTCHRRLGLREEICSILNQALEISLNVIPNDTDVDIDDVGTPLSSSSSLPPQ